MGWAFRVMNPCRDKVFLCSPKFQTCSGAHLALFNGFLPWGKAKSLRADSTAKVKWLYDLGCSDSGILKRFPAIYRAAIVVSWQNLCFVAKIYLRCNYIISLSLETKLLAGWPLSRGSINDRKNRFSHLSSVDRCWDCVSSVYIRVYTLG